MKMAGCSFKSCGQNSTLGYDPLGDAQEKMRNYRLNNQERVDAIKGAAKVVKHVAGKVGDTFDRSSECPGPAS